MNTPAYPNLMDINTAVKGTVEELLKKHQQQIPINIPQQPTINNPLNRFENRNQQTYPLGDILDEIKKEPRHSFEGYDNGSPINSEDYENDDPASFFLKPGKNYGSNNIIFFNTSKFCAGTLSFFWKGALLWPNLDF